MYFLVEMLITVQSRCTSMALISVCVLIIGMTPVTTSALAGRTVWDRVYTNTQADRGSRLFSEHCALCHAQNMRGGLGGAAALIGPEFQFTWNDKSVGALFVILRAKMPPGEAGSLSDQEYADILAAILQVNGFPAGQEQELPGDATLTSDIRITWDRP